MVGNDTGSLEIVDKVAGVICYRLLVLAGEVLKQKARSDSRLLR